MRGLMGTGRRALASRENGNRPEERKEDDDIAITPPTEQPASLPFRPSVINKPA